MPCSGMLRRVALVRTNVSEERNGTIIGVTSIGDSHHPDIGCDKFHRNIVSYQEPYGVTSQKTAFLIETSLLSCKMHSFLEIPLYGGFAV
jgi:hypothetical protein